MFCHKCGKEISEDAVVCVNCGVETKNLKDKNAPVNIVNQNSNTNKVKIPRVYNGFLDFIMICLTCGLWIIWMIIRPKYY